MRQHMCLVKTVEDVHDRFIIIDSRKVYQIGGSMKDLGKKTTTLIPMSEGIFSKEVIGVANTSWMSASPI